MKTPLKTRETETVNRAQLAKLMGVSLPTVDDWQRRGCPVAGTGSKGRSYAFKVPDVMTWRIEDERRRKGISLFSGSPAPAGPIYNPLRVLCADSVKSYLEYAFSAPMVEYMVEDLEKAGLSHEGAEQMVITSYLTMGMVYCQWVVSDRFDKQLGTIMDDTVAHGNATLKFIRGPLPDPGDQDVPPAINDLMCKHRGAPPTEDAP